MTHLTQAEKFLRGLPLLAWGTWLAGLVLACHLLLAGRDTGGALPMDASLLVLGAVALPAVALSPWMVRLSPAGSRLTTASGWAISLISLWWIFWLPATLQGMASSDRYGADNFSVPLPATASLQLAVVCVAVWLLSAQDLPWTRRVLSRWGMWAVLGGLTPLSADTVAGWAMTQPWLACAGLLAPLALLAGRRLGAAAPWQRMALRWAAAMSMTVSLWTGLYHWGPRLIPAGLNELGAWLLF